MEFHEIKLSSDYLNSSEFEQDSLHWKKQLSDIGNYLKFYNISSDNYKNLEIPLNNQRLGSFLNNHDSSRFEFIAAIFTLYL